MLFLASDQEAVVFQEAPIGKNGDIVELDVPDMRQPIAWEFALQAVKKQEEAEARQALGQGLDQRVQEVEVCCLSSTKLCSCLRQASFTSLCALCDALRDVRLS